MFYPQYSFQHSVLIIDQPKQYENLIVSGLLSFPVNFDFCPNRLGDVLQKIKESKPDLIVSSLEFVEGSIHDFIAKMAANLTKIPAIYITEPHLLDLQKKILKSGGAFDVVQRSTEPEELIKKMNRAVRVTREFKRSRIESFIELHEESKEKGIPVNDLLAEKKLSTPD